MRPALRLAALLLLMPSLALAKDVYLQIAGSVGMFRTDTRIFNPSASKDITISATYFQRAPSAARIDRTITVPARQMMIFDDVVASLFQGTDLGAIKLSSTDDFIATSRIFATTEGGTLGQFVVGQEPTAATTKGVLIQLKADGNPGEANTYRTNTGFVNPNGTAATVTIRQYGRDNVLTGQPVTVTVPPNGVVFPVRGVLGHLDYFRNAWLAFESNVPVFGFASVVENGTSDPTFVPAFEDATGGPRDLYLSIAGSVGEFRTDTGIFNPSETKDIIITATFMPRVGESSSSRVTKTITVPRRQMLIFENVVTSLFQASGLGAIKLSSADRFIATSRIFAQKTNGTLGQFVSGLEPSHARTKGVLTQLKSSGLPGQPGTFRVNTGFVNPNLTPSTVTIRQYDRNSAVVGSPMQVTVPAMGVVFPVESVLSASAANFSDAWIGYESTQALFGFGSVVDNGTDDPTFVPAFEDTGSSAPPTGKVFDLTARSWSFTAVPGGSRDIRVNKGDTVTLRISLAPGEQTEHGFALEQYHPAPIRLIPGGPVQVITFTVGQIDRTYAYFCTRTECGAGHITMTGRLIVGTGSNDDDDCVPYCY